MFLFNINKSNLGPNALFSYGKVTFGPLDEQRFKTMHACILWKKYSIGCPSALHDYDYRLIW